MLEKIGSSLRALFALLALAAAAAAQPSLAAAAPPVPASPALAGIDSAGIGVFVSDRADRPVAGLGRDDFELAVDGKPVPIVGVAPGASAQRLNLAVFVDDQNLTPEARVQALDALVALARTSLRRDDRLLIARYDGSEVSLRRPPAGDAAAVAAAFREVAAAPTRAGELTGGIGQGRRDEGQALLATLARFVDSLAGAHGRKALLFLTGGLDVPSGDGRLVEVVRRATAAGVVLYGLGAAANRAVEALQDTDLNPYTALNAQARSDDLLASLQELAAPTGGIASLDLGRSGDLLDRLRGDFADGYSLSFAAAPPAGADAEQHPLAVRLRGRPRLAVRAPASYLSRSLDERLADRTQAALDDGGAGENPLGVQVGFERDELAAYGRRALTVLLTLPLSRLQLREVGIDREGKVVVFVAARDSHGESPRLRRLEIPVRVAAGTLPAALAKSVAYRLKLELPPGASSLALGLRDELAGSVSTVTTTFTAGAVAAARSEAPPTGPPGSGHGAG